MNLLVVVGLLLCSWPQEYQKEIREEKELSVTAEQVTIVVDNLFGRVEVRRGESDKVVYRVLKTYYGETQAALDKALSEVQLGVLERNDSVIFYVSAPFICSHWEGCRKRGFCMDYDDEDFSFRFDYLLEIPASAQLDVRTVDKGDVTIEGIEGPIQASNVTGNVTLQGARLVSRASTISGDVDVYFQEVPGSDGRFETISGTINIYCKSGLNATISAKTMHGSLYSAFDYEQVKPTLIKQSSKSGSMTEYKLEETFGIAIGKNGPKLTFETLNGDIYLRKL